MPQKFMIGDVVRIGRKPISNMQYYKGWGKVAIVRERYHGDYGLNIEGEGKSAWWPAEVLTLIIAKDDPCPTCGKAR